jgi:anti-sigma factor NepR-like protein
VDQSVKSEEGNTGSDKPVRPERRRPHGSRKEDWIGQHLRQVYDDALHEDIPKDMLDLLNALEDEDSGSEKGTQA